MESLGIPRKGISAKRPPEDMVHFIKDIQYKPRCELSFGPEGSGSKGMRLPNCLSSHLGIE